MKEMEYYLKQKSFVINPNVLKRIKYLDINLDEFLLIVYFINIENKLDLVKMQEYYSFTEEELLNIFNSLVEKKLVEVIVKRSNATIDEEISLDLFYKKLIFNSKEEQKSEDIFTKFEVEFGRTLSPTEYELINSWIDKGFSSGVIEKALKEAVINGVSNLRYIDKLLYSINKKGNSELNNNSEEHVELFDYNWLDEKQ